MSEILHGDASGNQLNATANKTQIYGLSGNDSLISDGKSDVLLIGGSGDDSLIMSGGNGTLSGGEGSDTFELAYSDDKKLSATIEDLDPANDKIIVNFAGSAAPQLKSSVSGNDVVWKDSAGNFNVTIKGVRENDYFDGDVDEKVWDILRLTNDEREKKTASDNITRPWLTMSDGLTAGASIRVQEITEIDEQGVLDVFKHDRPNNLGGYSTVFDEVGKHYSAYAENITAGEPTAAEAMQDWIGSASHNVNIWNPNYLKLGVGYNYFDNGSLSVQRHYWEQLFGGSLRANERSTISTAELLTAIPEVNTVTTAITLTDNPDTYSNSLFGATIAALSGADSITNSGFNVSISGGNDNDTLQNSGSFVTINGGNGNDSISLDSAAQGILIQYTAGDGKDTVSGLNSSDTLSISGSEYTPVTVGNDVIVGVGEDSIKLTGAANLSLNIDGTKKSTQENLLIGTEGADSINNTVEGATIAALGGNDTIRNYGDAVSINAGAGNDYIRNYDSHNFPRNVTFFHESGNDTINGFWSDSTLKVAGGNWSSLISNSDLIFIDSESGDSISILSRGSSINIADADGNPVTVGNARDIRGTEGADNISNDFDDATIRALGGDDTINNNDKQRTVYIYESGNDIIEGFNYLDSINIGDYAWETIQSNQDVIVNIIDNSMTVGTVTLKDYNGQIVNIISSYVPPAVPGEEIYNDDESVSVIGTAGDDTITNGGYMVVMYDVTIAGMDGNDSIHNYWCNNVSIDAGTGNDSVIVDGGHNVTVNGSTGNDYFQYNWGAGTAYVYTGGNDTITGFNGLATLVIADNYSTQYINDDDNFNTVFIKVEDKGTITLTDYGQDRVNIVSSLTDLKHYNIILDTADNTTVNGTGGDDYIYTENTNVRINALAGDDYFDNNGDSTTFDGGAGDDYVNNQSGGTNASIVGGAGNDLINNNSNSSNVTIAGGAGNDTVNNNGSNVLIDGGAGNDTIENYGANVSINGGTDDDRINNYGASVTIDSGAGNDWVWNQANSVTIDSSDGNDWIFYGGNTDGSLNGGAGDDEIENYGTNVTIDGSDGNDLIYSFGDLSKVNGGSDNDTIINSSEHTTYVGGDSLSIDGDAGDDYILNDGDSVTIDGGDGSDYIKNGSTVHAIYSDGSEFGRGDSLSINGGAGSDYIYNYRGTDVSILGGTGNDEISLSADSRNNFIRYADGDGNDTVWGMTENDTLNFLADESLVSSVGSGDDLIYNLGTGSVLLIGARYKPPHITYGESGTEGGGSGSGGDGGGSSSGSGGGRGGNDGGSSGGTSDSADNNSDASGSKSAIGSRGRSTSTSSETGGRVSGVPRQSVDYTAEEQQAINAIKNPNNTSRSITSTGALTVPNVDFSSMQSTANLRIYAGGNMVVSDYQSGEKIIFAEIYTGSFYDAEGNYCVGSSTGALVIQNSVDKVVDLRDVAGNDFVKAYAATTAGVIDGRGLGGFEVINGSAGADAIFAGDGGSQMWGGFDVAADTLVGGGGMDIFIGGRTQGADVFANASSADIVHLNDASLSDIVATEENNGAIAIAFNTGNVVGVQSSEALSATFMLADGSSYRYDHANKSWQNA